MKPRSRLILILAIGAIALVIGIVLGMFDNIAEFFNIPPTAIDAFENFIKQYVAGMPVPPPIV
ncbi:MAG: hypothetical protein FK731_00430 [Asgard group archaeon]|nr:hypothetical protein [Asgard group archaeon]